MSEIPFKHIQRLASHGDDPQMPGAVRLSAKIVSGWLKESATPDNDEIAMIPKSEYQKLTEDAKKLSALEASMESLQADKEDD